MIKKGISIYRAVNKNTFFFKSKMTTSRKKKYWLISFGFKRGDREERVISNTALWEHFNNPPQSALNTTRHGTHTTDYLQE